MQYRAAIGLFNFMRRSPNKTSTMKQLTFIRILKEILNSSIFFLSMIIKSILILLITPIVLLTYSFFSKFSFLGIFFKIDNMIDYKIFHQIITAYIILSIRFVLNISTHALQRSFYNIKYILIHKIFKNNLLCIHILILINILLLCSGTVHPNPGWFCPTNYQQNTLSVCHWNVNGLTADNCSKITHLEAFLGTYKYDVVILGETFLSSKNDVDDNKLNINGYTIKRCDHPNDYARGGVCVYHKENLPLKLRPELTTLSECLVMEVQINKKKCFITALYRSPAVENNTTQAINIFLSKFQSIKILGIKIPLYPL